MQAITADIVIAYITHDNKPDLSSMGYLYRQRQTGAGRSDAPVCVV